MEHTRLNEVEIIFGGGKLCYKFWVKRSRCWSVASSSLLVLGVGKTRNNCNCDNIRSPLLRCEKNDGKIAPVDATLYDSDP